MTSLYKSIYDHNCENVSNPQEFGKIIAYSSKKPAGDSISKV